MESLQWSTAGGSTIEEIKMNRTFSLGGVQFPKSVAVSVSVLISSIPEVVAMQLRLFDFAAPSQASTTGGRTCSGGRRTANPLRKSTQADARGRVARLITSLAG